MKIFLTGLILFIISLGFASQALARHSRVLGDNTSSQITLPISQGPGLLLPNSPFYFIDLWRDNLTLLLASFTPETKAKLHLKIAAERIVEVKMMLESKNVSAPGLDTALANITQNIEGANQVLKSEKRQGKSIEKLASEINRTLNSQDVALRLLAQASNESTRLKIKAVEAMIVDDEVEIEDEMPEDELEQEIKNELEEEVDEEIEKTGESAQKAQLLLEKLREEASKSAQKALKKREEAVKKAIGSEGNICVQVITAAKNSNGECREFSTPCDVPAGWTKVNSCLVEKSQEKRLEELRKAQEKAIEDARKSAEEAKKASGELKNTTSSAND